MPEVEDSGECVRSSKEIVHEPPSCSPNTRALVALGASLFTLATAAAIRAQEPGDAPVRKELEAFREKSSKTAPPDRIRIYEQGIEEVRKSGVTDKALKVGEKAPDFELPVRAARRSSSRSGWPAAPSS